jgi:mannose-6-phosphate isomerase
MNTSASSATLAAELREHFAQIVLPLWRGPGFNAALNLPYEAVDSAHRPLPVVRYRAMACARQLFVFSQAGDAAHADTLFDALLSHFHDTLNGGWFFSVNAEGAPLDTSKDLYTHAFIVFACAEYFARSGNQDALDVMYDTSALITERFANARDGLLNASLDADFSTVTGTPLQNPLMHLTEAWLAAREATQDVAFGDALTRLVEVVARNFTHQPTGCIAELPLGSDDNRLEPGHQFEWFYLVRRAAGLLGTSGLDEALTRAFSFAQQHGVDPTTGGVAAALDEAGAIKDSAQRIWAQTEYLRALATHDSEAARIALPQQIERFRARFLRPHGWIESMTATGEITRAEMPSTTPYHLATAYASLPT